MKGTFLSVKVFNVDEPETVPGSLRKQDVFIADLVRKQQKTTNNIFFQ